MDVVELVDLSAASALEHAFVLQHHLRDADRTANPAIDECRAEVHRLVGDIVSLRNAAELLKRQTGAA